MNLSARYIVSRSGFIQVRLTTALTFLWLFAVLSFGLLPNTVAAPRPAVVLGSFAEQSNASAMVEKLSRREDLAGARLTVVAKGAPDHNSPKQPLIRVVAFNEDPSQTRVLLAQLRAAGFTNAWYLKDAQIDTPSDVARPSDRVAAGNERPLALGDETTNPSTSDDNARESRYILTDTSLPAVAASAETQVTAGESELEQPLAAAVAPVSKSVATSPVRTEAEPTAPTAAGNKDQISPNTPVSDTELAQTDQQGPQDGNEEATSHPLKSRVLPVWGAVTNAFTSESLQWSLDVKATQDSLPKSALKRPYFGDETSAYVADLHLKWQHRFDSVTLSLDHVLQWNAGDIIPWSRTPYGAPELRPLNDKPRRFDLTSELTDGDHHRLHSHFRELMVRWQGEQWSLGFGRDTISWGTGIVFHPLNLFNPLPPLHINGDDQLGQDHILVQRVWNRDAKPVHNLSFLHVGRRETPGLALSEDVSTTALKWHRKSERFAFGVTAAQHYGQTFIGLEAERQGNNLTISSNLALHEQSDRYSDTSWVVVGMANARLDISTPTRSASVFAEYFHNGFGVSVLPTSYDDLPAGLSYQLARQEAFTLMQDYIALGGDVDWSRRLTQHLSLITNLHDSSLMVKTELSRTFRDYLRLQLGLITSFGEEGEEFAPLRIGTTPNGDPITWGADRQIYLRLEFSR